MDSSANEEQTHSPAVLPADIQGSPAPLYESPMPFVDGTLPRSPYNPALADEAMRLPKLVFDERFWQLGFAFTSFVFASTFQVLFPDKNLTAEERMRQKAQAVRQLLFDLGPTFIKMGQFLSARGDVLPEQFAQELSLLQDRVPPFEVDLVEETIRLDLGASPRDLFVEFDPKPIASASIGQVHKVRLKDGGFAVIKVQRPGLSQQFYRDLGLMRMMARWWQICSALGFKLELPAPPPKVGHPTNIQKARPFDVREWLELSDEFGHTLFSEIDYLKEGRNADRLRRAVRSKPHIRVPRVHWKYTGRHVLTLEYIPGIKISQVDELKAQGFDLGHLGNMLINCYLEQFVLTGFFHADPHAGNLAVDEYGRLIIYDFGMMGEISEAHRRALLQCVMAVVRKDSNQVTKSLVELGIVTHDASQETVSRAISPFIDYYAGRDLLALDFQHLEGDVDQVIADRSFRLPANLAYLLRAGSSLEGIARTLQPDFSFVEAVRPVMTKWALQQGIESLAKSGKLLDFAEFAFHELRASMRDSSPGSEAIAELKTPGWRAKRDTKETKTDQPAEAPVIQKPQAPAKCPQCLKQVDQTRSLRRKLRIIQLIAGIYWLLSIASACLILGMTSSSGRQLCIYFLIGNLIFGAILLWKFTKLIKWSLQRIAEVETKGNGDK